MNTRNNVLFTLICCLCFVTSTKTAQEGGFTPLHIAALKNQIEIIKTCGIDLETRTGQGLTALSCAAALGNIDFMRALIAEHVTIETQDNRGATPLILASMAGQKTAIALLLSSNASIEARDNNGRTPLLAAAASGKKDAIIELLCAHANIEARDQEGRTPLALAAQFGHADAVRELIINHANVNARGADNNTPLDLALIDLDNDDVLHELIMAKAEFSQSNNIAPLHLAVMRGLLQTTKQLLQHHVDIEVEDDDGNTPLIHACFRGHLEIVNELLNAGANVHACNKKGTTAILAAALGGCNTIIQTLLALGANINDQQDKGNITPLHAAAFEERADTVNLCVHEGANIHALDAMGKKPRDVATNPTIIEYLDSLPAMVHQLSKAVVECNISEIRELLHNGAPACALTADGTTAIHMAIGGYDPYKATKLDSIARILIRQEGERVARVRDARGRTLLHIAALHGNLRLACLLVHNGAKINAQDNEGNTPLHLAPIDFSAQQMRNRLLEWHADVSITNNQGQTPLSRNIGLWHYLIEEMLQNSQNQSKKENAHS